MSEEDDELSNRGFVCLVLSFVLASWTFGYLLSLQPINLDRWHWWYFPWLATVLILSIAIWVFFSWISEIFLKRMGWPEEDE